VNRETGIGNRESGIGKLCCAFVRNIELSYHSD
jgi:hypothetical protein